MKYQDFKAHFQGFVLFSLADIRKLAPSFHRRQLSTWVEKGYIKKLRRGYYLFADTPLTEEALFLIANHLYAPSYVSFESALSYYGLIPEGVYAVTSATGKKTARFATPIAQFLYRKVRVQASFGYTLKEHAGRQYKIAEMEKAVLDYLYLNPRIVDEADFHEWRFNSGEFRVAADIAKFRKYAAAFGSKRLVARAEKFLRLCGAVE